MKTRQPLSPVLVPSRFVREAGRQPDAEIAAELNVQAVESFASAGDLVDYSAEGQLPGSG